MPTPTVRRLQLGNELRHLRERTGLTLEEAGKAIERSQAVMSRLEHGVTGLRQRDLRALVEFYQERVIDNDAVDVEWYLSLNKGADQRGHWSGYRAAYAKYFRMAVDLEADASTINWYEVEIVPGLLQTEEYVRALFTEAGTQSASESLIQARLERRTVLVSHQAPCVTFVLSESCIKRVQGSPAVMQGQIRYLLDISEQENVRMHILPFRSRAAGNARYQFTHYVIPAAGKASPLEFVYTESYRAGEYLDDPDSISSYKQLWGRLLGSALDTVDTRNYLIHAQSSYSE
ncbi:helix-turn-helix domain-containing protein [Actinoalloteichus caeruleus]|uniref:Helix-turn-helix domain-containing protein n=1 Tax=Actinoalloteichus caeruleus DSM 43889 TaxID=1120930 RepID=A0ABT1JLU6_ACTCY|nr:helix-turn-helix transcriptional regulator [Actinoalloteichus caeruleus]MCP2333118.1 Helix-turn-helix domain-containing protein [Actinoalloteichus caeruleus DSM 43889]